MPSISMDKLRNALLSAALLAALCTMLVYANSNTHCEALGYLYSQHTVYLCEGNEMWGREP